MIEQVTAAAHRLRGYAHPTPIMTSRTLDELTGARVFFKCENFQRAGAFKFRGAFNAISLLSEAQRARGIVTYSSGNHAQAVALVGRMLAIKSVVVMPDNASRAKLAATRGYGAEVVEYDPEETTRDRLAAELQARHGYTMVPPFDHMDIVAGQGTAALEMLQELGSLDTLLVPCGGGGLLSGSAIAAKGLAPRCRVVGIEPELADDATRSFRTRELQSVRNPPTIADGLRTHFLGEITFPLILRYVDDMRTVPEAAIVEAVKFLLHRMKIVVEPSGAVGLASLLCGAVQPRGKVGIILSGGNIDSETMKSILS